MNYGMPEDYEQLTKLGVDVKGKIVIARYGRSWRGIKPKVACEHGAVGCIIYSDPKDDGYFVGDVYPTGRYGRAGRAARQRDGHADLSRRPADAWHGRRRRRASGSSAATSKTLLKIPVLPISYGDALPLLRSLKAGCARELARRAADHLSRRRRPAKVHLKLAFDWQRGHSTTSSRGSRARSIPNEWIDPRQPSRRVGQRRVGSDQRQRGADGDRARASASCVKGGWRPKRTIILASWDGEEWGLLGSTEWVEKHAGATCRQAPWPTSTATARAKGWLEHGRLPLAAGLRQRSGARRTRPKRGSEERPGREGRSPSRARRPPTRRRRAIGRQRGDLPIAALGSGSDYTAFLDHLAIASLNLGLRRRGRGRRRVSLGLRLVLLVHPLLGWRLHAHGAALSRTIGTAILRLADADILPFEFTATASTLRGYATELDRLKKSIKDAPPLEVTLVLSAIERLAKAADNYDRAVTQHAARGAALDRAKQIELNRLLFTSERAFKHEAGLPKREWFKHLAYAPGFYTGYGVKTLPGIREGIEQRAWDEPRKFIPIVVTAINKLAAQVDQAAAMLTPR